MPFIPLSEAKPKGFTPVDGPAPDTRSILERFDSAAQEGVDSVGRQVGLTARAAVQGFPLVTIPNMVGDAVGLRSSDALRNALTKLGLPEPQNATERVVGDVASGMSGAGGMVKGGEVMAKAANPIVQRIGQVLSSGPASQVAAGATGAGAAGVTREKGGGPLAQLAAGVGGATVASLPSALAEGVKRLIRGGAAGQQRVADNIQTFEDAGVGTPTVGQATEARGSQALESVLAKTPGSAGTIAAKADQEAAGLGDKVGQMATVLSPRSGAEPAGRAITSGIKAFTSDFKKTSGKLYDEIDRFILPDSKVRVGETSKALDDLTKLMPGAENLSAQTVNPKITAIKEALASDAQHGTLPYAAVKELRSRIGKQLTDPDLVSDAPRAQLKQLYGALTKDLEVAAADAGPDAVQALKRANNFYRAGMKRVDDVLEPILNKGDPEKIFQAAISGTKEGSTTISGVMKSLPDESRKVVAATMLRRLGKATASKQDDLAEVFSPETFLTNWNKITPDSKRVLFSALPGSMRGDLDKIAQVASNMREGSKVFANPSGTTQGTASAMTAGGFVVSLLTGQFHAAAGIAGGVATAYGAGHLMTSPGFVHWLAKSTQVPVEQLPATLNQLFQASLYMKGAERKDVREFVKSAREAAASQGTGATQ
jgi:hypothetical protein